MNEQEALRRSLARLAQALPDAEARLVEATTNWRPENASAYKALYEQVQLLRSELERVAAELERLSRDED